jgi:hypothetical protein
VLVLRLMVLAWQSKQDGSQNLEEGRCGLGRFSLLHFGGGEPMKRLIVTKEQLKTHSHLIRRFEHFGWQVVVKG